MNSTSNRRWGSHSFGIHINSQEPWFDFHIVSIPWLGIFRLVLGKLSFNFTYPVDLGDDIGG